MRRIFLILVSISFLCGCATLSESTAVNRTNVLKLSIGLTKDEALRIMGTEPVTAYVWKNVGIYGKREAVAITNPYRSEILQGKDKTFEIIYYVTDVKTDNGVILDDDLTPLVFDGGKLIGWGWSFLNQNVQKYEIRMR